MKNSIYDLIKKALKNDKNGEYSPLKLSLISILAGFIIGMIILLLAGYNPITTYIKLIGGIFGKWKYISYVIIRSTPIILTGLSVAFAYNTGLFNIGAEGQVMVGTIAADMAGYFIKLPIIIHPIFCILVAMIAGGIWGGISGILKGKFGIHEVISTIMLNWIAFYLVNLSIEWEPFKLGTNTTHEIRQTASIEFLGAWKASEAGRAWLMKHPVLNDIMKTDINFGFLITIVVVIAIWFILKKTTLGYKLKAVGFNKDAAEYAGISVPGSVFTSMFIAGSLAGLAGATQVLGVSGNIATIAAMEGYGFDGIAVALIGSSHPIGVFFSGLFFGALKYGGIKIQLPPIRAPKEVINIMIGSIIVNMAMPEVIKVIRHKLSRKKKEVDNNVA